MKPSPLQERLIAALMTNGDIGASHEMASAAANLVLELIAAATPAEVVEEGTYLLGSSHLWADTQGTKATEHMVRRITGADQVVRGRLEKDLADLRADIERYNVRMVEGESLRKILQRVEWTCQDPDGGTPMFCPWCDGEQKDGHLDDCDLAKALR